MQFHAGSVETCGHSRECNYPRDDEVQIAVSFDAESPPQTVTKCQKVEYWSDQCCCEGFEPVTAEKSQVNPQH